MSRCKHLLVFFIGFHLSMLVGWVAWLVKLFLGNASKSSLPRNNGLFGWTRNYGTSSAESRIEYSLLINQVWHWLNLGYPGFLRNSWRLTEGGPWLTNGTNIWRLTEGWLHLTTILSRTRYRTSHLTVIGFTDQNRYTNQTGVYQTLRVPGKVPHPFKIVIYLVVKSASHPTSSIQLTNYWKICQSSLYSILISDLHLIYPSLSNL